MPKKNTVVGYTINEAVVLHFYLVFFMTFVGLMKFAGKLKHKNSRIVGLFEFVSGAFLLPGWSKVGTLLNNLPTAALYSIGSYLVCVALGIVTGDEKKRFSPVCWLHLFLTLGFIYNESMESVDLFGVTLNPIIICLLFFFYGHVMGRNFGNKSEKTKKTE